ncbi:endonuclease Q family protein [Sutcliffiella rhizosphaerae]|uniref:TIGR00375 family protein n=1 Tax=Sutcliffiella rhizosphaerae TaxID=2880967 RepID=A0ABN8AFU4_9BACI|nr:endonuclease Q family protein [Sutcliffiella rhizosphaerae]CAG9622372.1 hypothetical protein BACCIP111883_03163 [Sutcliffiella rhizosphaerae]
MKDYFADYHIHLGRTTSGKPVKITASNKMTLEAVLDEAQNKKGLDMVGVIDCQVPEVLIELRHGLANSDITELEGGGVRINELTLILGAEIEIFDENCQGLIHVLCYMPTVERMIDFSNWLGKRMKNITLSTQRVYESAKNVQQKVRELRGLFIPAHVFTPFKSLYGKGVNKSLTEVFDPALIDGIELGLSADTSMANALSELDSYSFLSNSDAHSVGKIAREYQKVRMKDPSFEEFRLALQEKEGRKVIANFGLSPKLGKYFTTVCDQCFGQFDITSRTCLHCGNTRFVKGVSSRIIELSNRAVTSENIRKRPPYIHQVPLDFIPGVGPKTLAKLRSVFGTEMGILHQATQAELEEVAGKKIASLIIAARNGKLSFQAGGGGKFGSIKGN